MSDTPRKHFLADARMAGEQLVRLLDPACERIEIAGSIRRQIAMVGDIEIVCQPRMTIDPTALLAGEEISALDGHVDRVIRSTKVASPLLKYYELNPANGSKYKRLVFHGGSNPNDRYKVDLFAVIAPASCGALMAIRTGPADWSHLLVTKRSLGGAMPDELQQANGALGPRRPDRHAHRRGLLRRPGPRLPAARGTHGEGTPQDARRPRGRRPLTYMHLRFFRGGTNASRNSQTS
jgi:hypothetical protein